MIAIRFVGAVGCCAALALAVTGCPKEPVAPAPPSAGGGAHYTIAVIPKGTSQSFWLAVKAGAEDAAKEANATINWDGPQDETEVARQIQIVQNAITRRVSGIVMAACDAKGLSQYVQQAMDAGIPVVIIDSGVDPDPSAAFLATDNVKGGEAAADALAEAMGGPGKVALVPFVQGAGSSDDREKGFKQGIAKHAGLDLGSRVIYSESDVSKALDRTKSLLTANPDIKGIFAANQGGAEGVIQAIVQMRLQGKVKLVCYDASETEVAALREGTVDALVVQNPYRMGFEGVKTVLRAIKKETIEPHTIDTGVTVVTKANIDTPEVQKVLDPTAKAP